MMATLDNPANAENLGFKEKDAQCVLKLKVAVTQRSNFDLERGLSDLRDVGVVKRGLATVLLHAIHTGYVYGVQTILNNGFDFEWSQELGFPCLPHAIQAGSLELVDYFLSNFVDPKQNYEFGLTALHHAVNCGRGDISRLLIEKGAKVDSTDRVGNTPLMTAIGKSDVLNAQILIEHGAAMDATVHSNILRQAIKKQDIAVVELLCRSGATRSPCDIHLAAQLQSTDIIGVLLEHGADINAVDDTGQTALFTADQETMVEYLLRKRIDPNITDYDGLPITYYLIINESQSLKWSKKYAVIHHLLIRYNADLEVRELDMDKLLRVKYLTTKVRNVLRRYANLGGASPRQPMTPLLLSLLLGLPEAARDFIASGSPMTGVLDANRECLLADSVTQDLELMTSLLERCARVRRLKTLCRSVICRVLQRGSVSDQVETLPLPEFLKGYLTMSDG